MQTSLQCPSVMIKDEALFWHRYFVGNRTVCNTKLPKNYFRPGMKPPGDAVGIFLAERTKQNKSYIAFLGQLPVYASVTTVSNIYAYGTF